MSYEIEKRFRHFDKKEVEKKLKECDFSKKGTYLFKIVTFLGNKPNQLIRIRDEGYRITLVVKQKKSQPNENSFEREWEIEINDFDKAVEIFVELGMRKKNIIEKIREIYIAPAAKYGHSELVFDHYPGLPAYIEIESDTEAHLEKIIEDIGLDGSENQSFGPAQLYRNLYQYRANPANRQLKNGFDSLTFAGVANNKGPNMSKNVDLFRQKIAEQHILLNSIIKSRNSTKQTRKSTTRKVSKKVKNQTKK